MAIAKPQCPVLNRNHPHASGLVLDLPISENAGTVVRDTIFGLQGTFPNSVTWQTKKYGVESLLTATENQYILLGNPTQLQITDDITILCYHRLTSTGNFQLVAKDNNTGGRAYTLDTTSAGGVRFYINGGGGGDLLDESRAQVTGDERIVVGQYRKSDKAIRLFIDGLMVRSGTADTSGIPTATANVLIGRREYSGAEQPLNGSVAWVRIWHRFLSAKEIADECADPWAIYRPRRRSVAKRSASKAWLHRAAHRSGRIA